MECILVLYTNMFLNKDRSQEVAVEGGLLFETKGFHQKLDETSYSHEK